MEVPLAVGRLVHRRAGEADEARVRQAGHQVIAQVAAGCPVRLVDQHVDVAPRVDVHRHVAELVDHRHDDAPVVVLEQSVEHGNVVRVLQVADPQGRQVFQHLVTLNRPRKYPARAYPRMSNDRRTFQASRHGR